jgi:diguanylate cyclase (GGDEF)-like protein/PAS domain S-box-containing protein
MAMLAVAAQLLVMTLDIGPNLNAEVVRNRHSLCETIAMSSSILASRGDLKGLEANLERVVAHNPDVLSAGVRRYDGVLFVDINDHSGTWIPPERIKSQQSQIYVPIQADGQEWGAVELRFRDLNGWSFRSFIRSPVLREVLVIGLVCAGMFYFFLRRVLRQLNPSRVIPGRVRAALDTMASGLMILDEDERIVLANRAFASVLGRDAETLQGFQAAELPWASRKEGAAPTDFPWSKSLRTGEVFTGNLLELNTENEQSHSYMVNSAPIAGEDGKCRGVLASFEDVTQFERTKAELQKMLDELRTSRDEVRRKNDELKLLATRDPLTGCVNRRAFFETFEVMWEGAARYKRGLSCVMVDVDHFKSINDKHGHSTGDMVLQKVAQALRNTARTCDVVCRYGGEEFCILLPQIDLENAVAAAERYRQAVQGLQIPDLRVTASLGVSSVALGASDPQGMIDQADKCLYVAKRNGRNQVIRWDAVPPDLVVDPTKVSREAPEASASRSSPSQDATALESTSPTAGAGSGEELETASIPFGVVSTLLAALAYRDSATAEHSRRVADLCVLLGSRLLSVRETYVLEMAALLHDIGKIGVPDAILLKPGPLTEEEWKVMAMHDHIGVDIVGSTFASPLLMDIIRNHHSVFGGRGRNDRLPSGTNIPTGARILAIADAYDAMVSNRVYRAGRSQEEAFAELQRCAGSQFDPDLVQQFIEAVRSHDQCRHQSSTHVSKQAAVQIGSQIEKLAEALDHRDCESMAALADRLKHVAQKQGVDEIANAAGRLMTSAADADLAEAVKLTIELLDLCRSIQDVHLEVDGRAANE